MLEKVTPKGKKVSEHERNMRNSNLKFWSPSHILLASPKSISLCVICPLMIVLLCPPIGMVWGLERLQLHCQEPKVRFELKYR